MNVRNFFIVTFIFSAHCQFSHYAARTGYGNRQYLKMKLEDKNTFQYESPLSEFDLSVDVFSDKNQTQMPDPIEIASMIDDKNEIKNRKPREDEWNDLFRFSLSSANPAHKILSVVKNEMTNQKILFISTYISFKDTSGYPYSQKKTADSVYFLSEEFKKFVYFLYDSPNKLEINTHYDQFNSTIKYVIYKQRDEKFRITILMKVSKGKEVTNIPFKYRTTWLNLNEYQYLLSRVSELMKIMEE